ncbi:G-patch and/or FHA domain containing protein, partial [Asbolus verrucosus]
MLKLRMKTQGLLQHSRESKDVGVQTEVVPNDPPNVPLSETEEPKSIAEEIKEAAELATQNSGFVYDATSGMYYDSSTGYYYNAEYGLYYDASSGTYLSYKHDTNTYEFHSQVYVPPQREERVPREVVKRKKKSKDQSKAAKCVRLDTDSSQSIETEEGECSITSGNESSDETNSDTSGTLFYVRVNKLTGDGQKVNSDVSKQWPPCMRIIVEQSQLPKIKVGSLHILTYDGGTLGREGNHAVVLPDINISKCHLKFAFDKERNAYFVTDVGSRNGTVLNGKRMSASKEESEALEVAHGSRIQIGGVVLLCHIHEGNKTCGLCEPGLIQTPEKKVEPFSKTTKSEQHKKELKKLRKKFGVSAFEEGNTKLASGYTDRAQKRRETVGSQNPHEKTEVASLTESISSQNKGFKMLSKMGWKEGQSLGKDSQGVLEPIQLISNPGTSGMGNAGPGTSDQQFDRSKQVIWKKTQERFKKLPTASIFEDSD